MAAGGRLPPDPQEGELYAKARRRRLSDCQNGKGHKHDANGEKSLDPDWWMIALTAGLVLVGGGQVWVLIRQTNILKQQAKYMKSVLRPRLSIRNVEIANVQSLLRVESEETVGTLQIYSGGGSNAHISGITCRLFAFDKLPMKAPYTPPDPFPDSINLPPGVYGTRSFPFGPVDFARYKGIRERAAGLYIMGELVYSDDLGIQRTTRFCRLFDWDKERFLPVTDPDYEYAD